jgi:GWxTD domain-containing protein
MKKVLFVLLTLISINICFSESLNIAVDTNRFFDASGNTILDINYQITYRNLKFLKTLEGFEATLETDFMIIKDDKVVYSDLLTNKIIVTDETKTRSNMLFTDKISLTLSKSDFHFVVIFKDIVSEFESSWEYDFELLPVDALVSDLELSKNVIVDSSKYLEKFHRGNELFMVNANHVFSTFDTNNVFIFYELQNFEIDANGYSDLQEDVILKKKDNIVFEKMNKISLNEEIIPRIQSIPIQDFEDGYYDLEVKITDKISGKLEEKGDFLSIKKPNLFTERMFVDLEDEFKLISFFLKGSQNKTWKTLSDDGKVNYLNRFWTNSDSDPLSEKNEFFEEVKERIEYSNKNFSHFDKGWSTDRGRIYLKNGRPDEVIEKDTGLYTKYSQKEYIIWKFRTRANKTYIFIDLQTSGNFRMIYADGDSNESSAANWQDYLGEDFDLNLLE